MISNGAGFVSGGCGCARSVFVFMQKSQQPVMWIRVRAASPFRPRGYRPRRNAEWRRQFVAFDFAQSDLDHVAERVAIENARNGVAHIDHQHPQSAVFFIRAGAALVGGFARAGDWREPSIDESHDFPHFDFVERFRDPVTTKFPAPRFDVSRAAKLQQDLLDELERKPLGFRQLGDGDHFAPERVRDADADQRAQSVFATAGEMHERMDIHSIYITQV
jgi:hypothetical protein